MNENKGCHRGLQADIRFDGEYTRTGRACFGVVICASQNLCGLNRMGFLGVSQRLIAENQGGLGAIGRELLPAMVPALGRAGEAGMREVLSVGWSDSGFLVGGISD